MGIPTVARADCPDRLHCFLMGAAITVHGADLATTENCIGAGACTEANKWLGRFNQPAVFGAVKMAQAAGIEWAINKLHDDHPKAAKWANLGIIVGYTGVVAHNISQSRRVSK